MTRSRKRRMKGNIDSMEGLLGCLWTVFIRDKICFVLIGFTFGILLTVIINYSKSYQTISLSPSYLQTARDMTLSLQYTPAMSNSIKFIGKNITNELLYGLKDGMQLKMKDVKMLQNAPKKIRLLYIVGNEGSGHHLWEHLLVEMSKHSKFINTNHVNNGDIITECLHACFMEIYHKAKNRMEKKEKQYFQSAKGNRNTRKTFIEYSCQCLTEELSKLVKNDHELPNNSLLYLRSFSYPFMGLELSKMPNVLTLIDITQMLQIDLKLIVMKREWVNCVVSSCIHRYGECADRIRFLPSVLSIIQSQILSIDTRYWIMIDYEDMMVRPEEYVDIINDWLMINDKLLIQNAIKTVVVPSKTTEHASGWEELKRGTMSDDQLLRNLLYSSYSASLYPLYNSKYFVVTPDNRLFLDSKY